MKRLNQSEVEEIVQSKVLPNVEKLRSSKSKSRPRFGLAESKAAKLVALAHYIGRVVQEGESLFFVSEWGIWLDVPGMVERVRASEGPADSLAAYPGELVLPEEEDYIRCLILLGLIFSWDMMFVNLETGNGFFCSHDEWVTPIGEESFVRKTAAVLEEEFEFPRFLGFRVAPEE
jgi:hypothetical protein